MQFRYNSCFFFLISSISLLLSFNVDKFLAFHTSLRSMRSHRTGWNRIEFRKKKIASAFDAGTKSGDQKSVQGRLVEEKYQFGSVFKRREETKSHFVLFEKKKNLFERKENWVETIDYYSRNFLFSRVVIIALIRFRKWSVVYCIFFAHQLFLSRSGNRNNFSHELVDFFFDCLTSQSV